MYFLSLNEYHIDLAPLNDGASMPTQSYMG